MTNAELLEKFPDQEVLVFDDNEGAFYKVKVVELQGKVALVFDSWLTEPDPHYD